MSNLMHSRASSSSSARTAASSDDDSDIPAPFSLSRIQSSAQAVLRNVEGFLLVPKTTSGTTPSTNPFEQTVRLLFQSCSTGADANVVVDTAPLSRQYSDSALSRQDQLSTRHPNTPLRAGPSPQRRTHSAPILPRYDARPLGEDVYASLFIDTTKQRTSPLFSRTHPTQQSFIVAHDATHSFDDQVSAISAHTLDALAAEEQELHKRRSEQEWHAIMGTPPRKDCSMESNNSWNTSSSLERRKRIVNTSLEKQQVDRTRIRHRKQTSLMHRMKDRSFVTTTTTTSNSSDTSSIQFRRHFEQDELTYWKSLKQQQQHPHDIVVMPQMGEI